MSTQLSVKNIVCPRCIQSVQNLLVDLNIDYESVQLGTIILPTPLTASTHAALTRGLLERGFELLEDRESQLVNCIKSQLVDWVHYQTDDSLLNLSDRLAKALNKDYSTLSKTFSQHQGITIEQYWMRQRIERAKELLRYGEQTVGTIALELGYSSTAHFSNQFKKNTGYSPRTYQKLNHNDRQFLDDV